MKNRLKILNQIIYYPDPTKKVGSIYSQPLTAGQKNAVNICQQIVDKPTKINLKIEIENT